MGMRWNRLDQWSRQNRLSLISFYMHITNNVTNFLTCLHTTMYRRVHGEEKWLLFIKKTPANLLWTSEICIVAH